MRQLGEEQRKLDKRQAQQDNLYDSLDGCTKSLRGAIGQLNMLTPAEDDSMQVAINKLQGIQQLLNEYFAKTDPVKKVVSTTEQSPFDTTAPEPIVSPLRLVPPVFDMQIEPGLDTAPALTPEPTPVLPVNKRKRSDEEDTSAASDETVSTKSPAKKIRKSETPPPPPSPTRIPKPPREKTPLMLIKLAHNNHDVKVPLNAINKTHVMDGQPGMEFCKTRHKNGEIEVAITSHSFFKPRAGNNLSTQVRQPRQEEVDIDIYGPSKTRSGKTYL